MSRKVSVNICKAWCLDERCCSRILGLEVYHSATFTCVPLWVLEAGNNTDDKEVEIHVKPVDKRGAGSPAGARFLLLVKRQYHARTAAGAPFSILVPNSEIYFLIFTRALPIFPAASKTRMVTVYSPADGTATSNEYVSFGPSEMPSSA